MIKIIKKTQEKEEDDVRGLVRDLLDIRRRAAEIVAKGNTAYGEGISVRSIDEENCGVEVGVSFCSFRNEITIDARDALSKDRLESGGVVFVMDGKEAGLLDKFMTKDDYEQQD